MPDTIKRETDTLVRWVGPYKKSANTVIDIATEASAVVTLRVYLEDVEMRMIAATTRTREDMASAATTITIPHFELAWLETGDTLEWRTDNGQLISKAITYSAGTDIEVEATNFDTLTWTGGADGDCAKGTVMTLVKKAAANKIIPVSFKARALDQVTGHKVSIETDSPIVEVTANVLAPPVQSIESSEEGEAAENQEQFYILQCDTLTGSATLSPGARIRVKIGDDIAMAGYGTAVVGNEDWGWEGTIPDLITQSAVINNGDQLRLIVTLSGLAGFQEVVSKLVKVVEA